MAAIAPPVSGKDEVWWTELELRRLGNVVAEMLHSRRYEADGRERAELRRYLDAMRRKALRVLHCAERAGSGDIEWPGLDADVADPVALAEAYVSSIERYEAEFGAAAPLPAGVIEGEDEEEDDWEARDREEYDRALKAEMEEGARGQLLAGATSEVRQRKTARLTKADEEFLAKHQPVQEQLTATLADAVGQLKKSVTQTGEQMRQDEHVVDETSDAIDKNLDGVKKQRNDLAKLERSSSMSWWMLIILAVVGIGLFAFVLLVLSVPM